MGVHLPPTRGRITLDVGIGIELGEELLQRQRPDGQHERLVPVVARAPVTGSKRPRHRQLGHLLAVTEDAELRLARQHLAAAQQAGLPASAHRAGSRAECCRG